MELFVKLQDAEGTCLLLTKQEMENINRRLEFSHTIKVWGDDASRPLYLMPTEFERGKRRFGTYGDDESKFLDIQKAAAWDQKVYNVKKKSETILIGLLAIAAVSIWYLGGGKTPAVAYAILTPSMSGAGLVLPVIVGIGLIAGAAVGVIKYQKRKQDGVQIEEEKKEK